VTSWLPPQHTVACVALDGARLALAVADPSGRVVVAEQLFHPTGAGAAFLAVAARAWSKAKGATP
jgi:hypothetical protein